MASASDDFAGSGALSANWSVVSGAAERDAGVYRLTTGTGGDYPGAQAHWVGDSFGDDQFAECAIVDASLNFCGPVVRGQGDGTGYCAVCNNTTITIVRIGVGTLADITGLTIADGDIVGLSIEGDSLQAYLNGAPVGSPVTNSTFSTGSVGLLTVASNRPLDNWRGGDLADIGGGGGGAPVLLLRQLRD